MPNSRDVTPSSEADRAHDVQSSDQKGKRKWSPERDSSIREPRTGIWPLSINGTKNNAKEFCSLLTYVFPQNTYSLYR